MEYSLKQLCEKAGVTRRMVQEYEKAGLMKPDHREKHGYLRYGEGSLARVKELKRYRSFGMTIREMADIDKMSESQKADFLSRKLRLLEENRKQIETAIRNIQKIICEIQNNVDCT